MEVTAPTNTAASSSSTAAIQLVCTPVWSQRRRSATERFRVRGRYKDNITLYVTFFVRVEHGVDDDGDACLKLIDVVWWKPVLMRKGQPSGKIKNHLKRDAKNREHRHVLATVAKKGKMNEFPMSYGYGISLLQFSVTRKHLF